MKVVFTNSVISNSSIISEFFDSINGEISDWNITKISKTKTTQKNKPAGKY
jgi:hypothetical protein